MGNIREIALAKIIGGVSEEELTAKLADKADKADFDALDEEVNGLKSALEDSDTIALLHMDEINDTVQSIVFDSVGNVSTITHARGNTVIRTDAFTFADGSITEVRTLNTGETLTIVTNTTTLATTVTYAAAA